MIERGGFVILELKVKEVLYMKDVVILTGAGQIGMAIARRVSMGKKLVIGDKSRANGETITKIMNEAGFDAVFVECDLSSRESILNLISEAQKFGEIVHLIRLVFLHRNKRKD